VSACILLSLEATPEGLTDKLFGAARGASGTASGSLPRYADISRYANAGKSHSFRDSRSTAPILPCGAACAMELRWRCGAGKVQARLRHGGLEASVDEESCPEKQPTRNALVSLILTNPVHRPPLRLRAARRRTWRRSDSFPGIVEIKRPNVPSYKSVKYGLPWHQLIPATILHRVKRCLYLLVTCSRDMPTSRRYP
jgi:hypothetical protein